MSTKIGKYDILEILGRGGMGVVYKAYDPILDREVALKTMTADGLKDPVLRERFYREARAAGKLRHPNIVTIYELGEENNVPFIAMEYIQGSDVYNVIRMRTEVAFEQKIRIVVQICRGLAYAHKAGIVHRDIKPSNVRLNEDMHVKILDFGVARLVTSQTMTTNGMVLGTIHYMAPEQIKGAHVDRKADIFAVGVIFYELLAYKKPFEGDNTATVLYRVLHEAPTRMNPPVDEQFPTIRRALAKALDKDPARRYFSADEMADELEEFLRSHCGVSRVSTVEYAKDPKDPITLDLPNPLLPKQKGADHAAAKPPDSRPPTPQKTDPRTTELLKTARRLIVEGHAIYALNNLKQAIGTDPENDEAKQLLSMVESDIKRSESEELLKQAQQYMREGRHDIALKAFEKILKLDPDNSKVRMLLETLRNEVMNPRLEELIANAREAYSNKKYQLAWKYVEEVLKIKEDNQEAQELKLVLSERIKAEEFNEILRSAEDFIREQQFETAQRALDKALKIYPQHPVAQKRMETVNDHLRRIEIDGLVLRGNKALELGNFDSAHRTFQRILELDPKNSTAKMVIAYIGEKLRFEEIAQMLNEGWRMLMMERNYDAVIQLCEKILSMDSRNSEANSLLASAHREKQKG